MGPAAKQQTTKKALTPWQAYQAAVLARPDLTTDDKLVFIELARRANYTGAIGGNSAPPFSEIAERYSKSVQWVSRAVRHLKTRGIIETVRQQNAEATVTESQNVEITSIHQPTEFTYAKPSE